MKFRDSEFIPTEVIERLTRWVKEMIRFSEGSEIEVIHFWNCEQKYFFVVQHNEKPYGRTEYFLRIFKHLKDWVLSSDGNRKIRQS